MTKLLYIFLFLLVTAPVFSQNPMITINGIPAENTCMPIRTIRGSLDTMHGKWVGIYHAEIVGDCLELSIMYGGCKPDMEFVTDNEVFESRGNTLNCLLKYTIPVTDPCKDTQKTKLSFDLLPFKDVKPGKAIYIALKGSVFTLGYLQKQIK
jgi:hypothetical protein